MLGSVQNKQFRFEHFGQLCLLTKIDIFFSNPSTNYLSWEFGWEKDYLTSVDDFSEMRTQLKNRDGRMNYILSALSRGIVGLAQVRAHVLCHFFPVDGAGRFQTPRMPHSRLPIDAGYRLAVRGVDQEDPTGSFAAYGLFASKGP